MRLWVLAFAGATLLLASPAAAGPTDFTAEAINGKWNGKNIGLRSFKKKVVYMTFFATWCKPCLTEMKHLRKIYKKYKGKGLVVLAVSVDEPQTRSRVRPTIKRYRIKYPVVIDTQGQVVRLYNPKRATPYSVLFDRNGKILKTRTAFQISDLPEMEKEISEAVSK
jgi:peroxiredoxin